MNFKNFFSKKEKTIKQPHDIEISEAVQLLEATIGKFNREMLGTSGTIIYGDIYDEEYLQALKGITRADIYDKMRRMDGQIQMLLTTMINNMVRANWFIEAATSKDPEENERYKRQADHVRYELFERQTKSFSSLLREIFSFEYHGFSAFEKTHTLVKGDPEYGDYIGYKNLGFRSQRTVERFTLNRDGTIKHITQSANGDLDSGNVEIPGEFLLIFSLNKIGDNYEGISRLRHIYGNFFRKCIYNKLMPVGIERYAVGTPIGTIPAGKENTSEKSIFVKALKLFTSHQNSYMVKPKGWDVEMFNGEFDAEKVSKAIEAENLEMARSFVAQHLQLGTGGNGGAYALAADFSDSFLSILEDDANLAVEGLQKGVVKEFINHNYGKQKKYPQLKVSGINDKWGKEFAEIVKFLTEVKHLTPTKSTEVFLRKNFKMNELSEDELAQIDDVRKVEPEAVAPMQMSEKESRITLAENSKTAKKIQGQITTAQDDLRTLMAEQLTKHSDTFLKDIENQLNKLPQSKWRSVVRTSEMSGQREYRESLKAFLVELATKSVTQINSELSKSEIKMGEVDDKLKKLPPKTRELIKTQIALLVGTQTADLEKNILFMLNGSVDSTNDVKLIMKDLKESRDKYIGGAAMTAAGGNTAGQIYNSARNEIMSVPIASGELQYLEFVNDDPESPICMDLAGTIFHADDPEAQRFFPLLHHNCKSVLLPVFKIPKGRKVSGTGLKPSNPKLEKFITL